MLDKSKEDKNKETLYSNLFIEYIKKITCKIFFSFIIDIKNLKHLEINLISNKLNN